MTLRMFDTNSFCAYYMFNVKHTKHNNTRQILSLSLIRLFAYADIYRHMGNMVWLNKLNFFCVLHAMFLYKKK